MFVKNSARVLKQKKAPLRVIMGNPPYSIGQKSANDNAQNQKYDFLDSRIANTYVKESTAGLNKSSYDTYKKAFRWSTDRLDPEHGGVIGFISNGSWLDANSEDGFRKMLEKEFTSIWIFNLRGNQRTKGELSRKEGGKLFGSGSRNQIAITFLVKNPDSKAKKASIHYHDIGDYLSREEKLDTISKFSSIANHEMKWVRLQPNEYGDWLNQRNDLFDTLLPLAPEKKFDLKTQSFFNTFAIGVSTNRDHWVYNFSAKKAEENMKQTIDFYNKQRKGFLAAKAKNRKLEIDDFIDTDPSKISWTVNLKSDLERDIEHKYKKEEMKVGAYRTFTKNRLYFDKPFIERPGLNDKFFPTPATKNLVICISPSANDILSVLITDQLPNLHFNGDTQAFPLYYYEEQDKQSPTLWDYASEDKSDYIRRDGVSDFILERAKKQYGKNVTKEDIFYYVYGILHSPDYRTTFANDLKKMLPRLPLVEDVKDFWKFSKIGRQLAELHVKYEEVEPYKGVKVEYKGDSHLKDDCHLVKMRFPAKGQKDTIIYNSKITISNIPAQAYEYVVNGKSAIEWVMERYQVTTHAESGIVNDPNDWAKEVGNPRYILDLLLSVINVSVQTVELVSQLPNVKFE
jgi:predicted helicase